jgi:hypothetical protein
MLMLAEQRFRKLDAPEKMEMVFRGVQFRDSVTLSPFSEVYLSEELTEKDKVLVIV